MVSGRSSSSSSPSPHLMGNGGATSPTPHNNPPAHTNNQPLLLSPHEKRIIAQFTHLQDKSKQLFNQLRDLPPHFSTLGAAYNPHHQSNVTSQPDSSNSLSCQQAYFSRAFDIFTKLWKFQQMHRQILDKKYGLKRWQIGDIASKIGQLYYHYYLRTSELGYLQEALSFYGAIRGRGYYANRGINAPSGARGQEEGDQESGLIVKKLRYYARFILVSLLLRKTNLKDLLRELSLHVENYVATVEDEPEEQLEWNLVLSEIRGFMDADSPVLVYDNSTEKLVDPLDQVLILSHRLPRGITPKNYRPGEEELIGGSKDTSYRLHEILIVGNKGEQVKFSELTVDMFRMSQTFERADPVEERGEGGRGLLGLGPPPHEPSTPLLYKNPHKYLLYRAPIEQILVTLNAAWSDLPWNGVLLLYLSADPSADNTALATTNKTFKSKAYDLRHTPPSPPEGGKEINSLYPSDLLPLTRKPLLLIVESENSESFVGVGEAGWGFGAPVVVLLSPEERGPVTTSTTRGSVFTLFLHCPLAGLCTVCGVKSVSLSSWNQLEHLLNIFLSEAYERLRSEFHSEARDGNWSRYMKLIPDDFIRLIILRFLFAQLLYDMHRDFQERGIRPKCYPQVSLLGKDWSRTQNSPLQQLILEMADLIQSKHLFNLI